MKLFIFGSTGDLVKRYILPALESISKKNSGLFVVALGRRPWTTKQYIEFACTDATSDFKSRISYELVDFNKELIFQQYKSVMNKDEVNYYYLSVPPKLQEKAILFLGKLKKEGYKIKILIEKPFGHDLSSAKKLSKLVSSLKLEKDIVISDHYLFKDNILSLHKKDFSKLSIVSIEKLGYEGRSYFDEVGTVNDMLQSHLVNIALKFVSKEELSDSEIIEFKIGQYGNGKNEGYVSEVGKPSSTETFASVLLKNKSGKEIYLASGKGFMAKESFIEIDGKKYHIDSPKSPYVNLFNSFFLGSTKNFPTVSQSIFAWGFVHRLKKSKPELFYYKKGIDYKSLK